MIATRRGLAILAAVAVALLALSFVAGRGSHGPVDRSLLPGFDERKVSELVFERRDATSIRVVRTDAGWHWKNTGAAADPSTIDAALSALRGGVWHRKAPARTAGPARALVIVDGHTLGIANELPGTGQTWIVRGDDALLVDNWVATALAPEPLALRVRQPLACTNHVSAVTANETVRIEGSHLVEPRAMWLDERWLRSLADACAAVEIVALDGTRDERKGLKIVGDGQLAEVGTCDGGRVLVDTSSGHGCVEAARLRALADLLRDPAPDPRPLPIDPATLTLQDGTVLDVAAKRIGDTDADPDHVRELITALQTRGLATKPRPTTKPRATITAVDKTGAQVVLELFDRQIARRDEPAAIDIAPDAWATIARPASALRDATRWREDPTTISSLTLDNVTYKRGAVLGEWTREPAGTLEPALVDALVESVATLRAPTAPPPASIAHRLRITITPPAGAPITHAIDFAAPTEQGCAARVDSAPMQLPLAVCTAALALASASSR